jgi:hypothetical protein
MVNFTELYIEITIHLLSYISGFEVTRESASSGLKLRFRFNADGDSLSDCVKLRSSDLVRLSKDLLVGAAANSG